MITQDTLLLLILLLLARTVSGLFVNDTKLVSADCTQVGGCDHKKKVLSIHMPPPDSNEGKKIRKQFEKLWIHRMKTNRPPGLNILD